MSRNLVNPITGSLMPIAGYGQSGNFEGSWDQWNALTEAQKAQFRTMDINNDFNGMPIDTDLDATSIHPVENQAIAKNIEAMVNVYGSKNLLPNNAVTQIYRGITYTVNSDGSISTSGTAEFESHIDIVSGFYLKSGKYIISKAGNDSEIISSSNYNYEFYVQIGNNSYDISNQDIEVDINSTDAITFSLYISANKTVTKTVYPMIRDSRITDPTYVPYAMTNRELTENVIKTVETSVMLSQVTWATVSDESSPMYYVTDLYSLPNARKIISAEITNFARLKTTDFIQPFIYNKALGLMGNTNFSGRSYANIQIQIAYI